MPWTTLLGAHQKGLELESAVAESVPRIVIGDPQRLRQGLHNLIGNAGKFTERGKNNRPVYTEQSGAETQLWFKVRDTGIGIPEAKLDDIFEAFVQADGSTTRKHGGT